MWEETIRGGTISQIGSPSTVHQCKHGGKCGLEPHRLNKTESDPERSGHLETSTPKILAPDIDFGNRRSETYSEVAGLYIRFVLPYVQLLHRGY